MGRKSSGKSGGKKEIKEDAVSSTTNVSPSTADARDEAEVKSDKKVNATNVEETINEKPPVVGDNEDGAVIENSLVMSQLKQCSQEMLDAGKPLPIPPFSIGSRVNCSMNEEVKKGTVLAHWEDVEYDRKDGTKVLDISPYSVRLDCGLGVNFSWNSLTDANEPRLDVVFQLGSRVECNLGDVEKRWFPGTVVFVNKNWVKGSTNTGRTTAPYIIRYDYGKEKVFYGSNDDIRASDVAAPKDETNQTGLRFKIGDRVECSMDGGYQTGTVIKLWYSGESNFEGDYAVPYQVELDDQSKIYAPIDEDCCIRLSKRDGPECWICYESEQSESNRLVRECACRGDNNGFVHIKCLVKLALSKADLDVEPMVNEDEPFVFTECLTCKQNYQTGSQCHSALAKAFHNLCQDTDISNTWNKMSLTMMCDHLVNNEEYEEAEKLLLERISKIRSRIESQGKTFHLRKDLANFLVDLTNLYDNQDSFPQMKETLDDLVAVIEDLGDLCPSVIEVNMFIARSSYEKQVGNKVKALEHMENAIALAQREDELLLFDVGVLNVECNNVEKGLEQLEKYLEIISRYYGRNHYKVEATREYVSELRKKWEEQNESTESGEK